MFNAEGTYTYPGNCYCNSTPEHNNPVSVVLYFYFSLDLSSNPLMGLSGAGLAPDGFFSRYNRCYAGYSVNKCMTASTTCDGYADAGIYCWNTNTSE